MLSSYEYMSLKHPDSESSSQHVSNAQFKSSKPTKFVGGSGKLPLPRAWPVRPELENAIIDSFMAEQETAETKTGDPARYVHYKSTNRAGSRQAGKGLGA